MTKINLLPWREERRVERQKQFYMVMALVIAAAVGVGFLISNYYADQTASQRLRNDFLAKEIRVLDAKIDEIKALRDTRKQLIERMELIQALQGNRPIIVRIFDEFARSVPDDLYFTAVSVKGTVVTVKGVAKSNNRVSSLMRNFDQSPWFANPSLLRVQAKGEGVNEFEIVMTRVEPKSAEEQD
jgi:type IV pilus assembly protein PilN